MNLSPEPAPALRALAPSGETPSGETPSGETSLSAET